MKDSASERQLTKLFDSPVQIFVFVNCRTGDIKRNPLETGAIGANQCVVAQKIKLAGNSLAVLDNLLERIFRKYPVRGAAGVTQLVVNVFIGLVALKAIQNRSRTDTLV